MAGRPPVLEAPLAPGSTIGILGGGQLGRMLALAAAPLGFKVHVYSDARGPAFDVASETTVGSYDDLVAIEAFARSVDAVTFEFENVPVAAAEMAAAIGLVRPGPQALQVAQDRLIEKQYIAGLGIPVAPFRAVDGEADLKAAITEIGLPAILKTRRLGYDGRGQVRLSNTDEVRDALQLIGHAPAILEGHVAFDYEVSVLIVRGADGRSSFYDVPINNHKNGILDTSAVPSPLPEPAVRRAEEIARIIADQLGYVGLLAVEMFYCGSGPQGGLVVNEIAPRVHNSGHWTIDACEVSQFENHIRAVAGWPLGPTARRCDAVMTNLIGADANGWEALAADTAARLHLYGKNDPRPGRKMGHVTRLATPGRRPA